jgi:hypothetical protein
LKTTGTNTTKSTRGIAGETNFSFGTGTAYGDVAEYISENRTFDVLAITFEPGRGYEGRDRESETLTLGSNPARDEQLRAAQAHLEAGGTIQHKRLRNSGNAYYLVDGDR